MTPFVSIWTNRDTAESGPTMDEQAAEVTTDFAELTTVLHVATDGPYGRWTVAVTLDAENAVSLIEKIAERYGLTVKPEVLGKEETWGELLADPEDEDELYDDGKTLIAGVLYDNETGEEADPQ